MKRLTRFLFLVFLIVTFCTACNGDITRDIRHAGFNMNGKFECSKFLPDSKNDLNYGKIKYMTDKHIIDSDGKIYELSLSQKFANNENCKEISTDIVVKAIFDSNIVKGRDNKYYYLVAQNNTPVYTEVTELDNSYELYDLLLKDDDIVKVTTVDSSSGLYYALKDDGSVYSYKVSRVDRNSPLVVNEVTVVYSSGQYGHIVDYNYVGEKANTFIMSEDKLYRMKAINAENCNKYADIDCIYELLEDSVLEEYKNVIISYNGNILITNYGQVFTVVS